MAERLTGVYAKDPRVERAISWALVTAATVALTVGAWFFRDLSSTVKSLNEAVIGLKTEVAVLAVDREDIEELKEDVRELRQRLRAVEQR